MTQGINVDFGEYCEWWIIEEAVAQGPQPSASTMESFQIFSEDVVYQEKSVFLAFIYGNISIVCAYQR